MPEKPIISDAFIIQTRPGAITVPENALAIVNDAGTFKSQAPDGTLTALGGGTVHSSSPVSGDGSVATPLTIADSSIANSKLVTPPQSPSAVAITGGTITGVNTATRTTQGAMSAADKGFSDDFDSFRKAAYATMIAADPTLTGFKYLALGSVPLGQTTTTVSNDAAKEGGALDGAAQLFFWASTFQNTPGGHWAVFYEGFSALPTGVVVCQFGIGSKAGPGTDAVWVGTHHALDGTNFHGRITAGASITEINTTTVADVNRHIFGITDDATTVKLWLDGVLIGSTATRTNLVTTQMFPYIYGNTAGSCTAHNLAFGYIK